MLTAKKLSGIVLASAAAGLFAAAPMIASADEGKIHCAGVNSCKGKSACKSATNACKGQNSCKGKGFLEMTKKQCDAAKEKMEKESKVK